MSGSVLTGSELKAPSCLVHMIVELGIWSPPGPQPGQSWASPVLPAGDEGSSERWVQRGLTSFYSAELSSEPARRQCGAL